MGYQAMSLPSSVYLVILFFKQKTAYEMRISDWSSDVCSSDRRAHAGGHKIVPWTVNRRSDMLRLMQLDIDGVISDFPGCALQMQSRLASARLMPTVLGAPDAPLCQL